MKKVLVSVLLLPLMVLASMAHGAGSKGPTISHLKNVPYYGVSFVLTNESRNSGTVVMWVEQNDNEGCYGKLTMPSNDVVGVRLPCKFDPSFGIVVKVDWADNTPDRASKASNL